MTAGTCLAVCSGQHQPTTAVVQAVKATPAKRPCTFASQRQQRWRSLAVVGTVSETQTQQQQHTPALAALRQLSLNLVKAAAIAAVALQPALPAVAAPYELLGEELFDPMAYIGRWYEVASLKKGFAGEGQQDCHCTQGIYVPLPDTNGSSDLKVQVNTFCVHGGPSGRLSGIQGSVSCANPVLLELLPEFKTESERDEGIMAKCVLNFDSLPFLPAQTYNVIRTDYTSYALVSGAKDRSFVQIYSRTPNPGPDFIARHKQTLADLGYAAAEIVDTPQDCPEMEPAAMMKAMDAGMRNTPIMPSSTPPALAMRGYDLGPASDTVQSPITGIQFDRLRNPVESLKNFIRLFGM